MNEPTQSPPPNPPTPPTSIVLPRPEEMSSEERINQLNAYRSKIIAKETVSDEELRWALDVLRLERGVKSAPAGKAKKEAPKPATIADL